MNTITKAMDVQRAYDAAHSDNISSEGCYSRAIVAAWAFDGIEVYNSNDDADRTYSFAPTRDFVFDDASSVQVTYGGVFVILPNEPY